MALGIAARYDAVTVGDHGRRMRSGHATVAVVSEVVRRLEATGSVVSEISKSGAGNRWGFAAGHSAHSA
jgi:hypothetical protein